MTVADAVALLSTHAVIAALRSRYSEPWRYYHAWEHPMAMLAHLGRAEADGVEIADPVACVGFILWHDAIYDPQAVGGRNERLSAALCRVEMDAAVEQVERACAAIVSTITHVAPDVAEVPDGALLLDIDLSILGAGKLDFDAYDAAIRSEYAHVPEVDYRRGRAVILTSFLARDRLYLTPWGAAQWEDRARRNLAGAIRTLSA